MERLKLYYSSEEVEPWADLDEIHSLLLSLKEEGVSVEKIDTAEMTEAEIKEFYTSSVILPSIKKKYKISSVFGTRREAGAFFGKKQPGLVVYRKGAETPVDVYPHDENGRRISIADFLREKLSYFEQNT